MGANESSPTVIGRYLLASEIASGGMASVCLGRIRGAVGFARVVAIKRLHPNLAKEPDFVSMFVDEARMAARIHHAHVVPTLDVVADGTELCLVMEYVNGDSLASLLKRTSSRSEPLPIDIALAVASGALRGLHAAHEAKNERSEPLHIVHRDVSPQNILVGVDGVTRVFDFGVAKATGRLRTTGDGSVKGKCAYMAPEQLLNEPLDRRADIYALGVVLWESLTSTRLFPGDTAAASITKVLHGVVHPPSTLRPDVPPDVDAVVMKALERSPRDRFATAHDMAVAIDACTLKPASITRVSEWVNRFAADTIAMRNAAVAALEEGSGAGTDVRMASNGGAPLRTATSLTVDARLPGASVSGSGELVAKPTPRRDRRAVLAAAASGVAILVAAGTIFVRTRAGMVPTTTEHASSPPPSASGSSLAPAAEAVTASPAAPIASGPAPAPPSSSGPGVRASSRATSSPPRKSTTARPAARAPSDDDTYGFSH